MLVTENSDNNNNYDISNELDFILSHFKDANKWSRNISTYGTGGSQIYCTSKDLALFFYNAADFIDCKISAYISNINCNDIFPIDFLMIDIDSAGFRSKESLERARLEVERKIKNTFGKAYSKAYTIIWSGNGYHFYVPIEPDKIIFEQIDYLAEFRDHPDLPLSRSFLRFAEDYLSCGKCDSEHNKDTSFKNCMLRIPGTHNSKCLLNYKNKGIKSIDTQVRIIKRWDGRPGS